MELSHPLKRAKLSKRKINCDIFQIFTYFILEVKNMDERRKIGVVVDAGHGGIG